MKRVPFSFVALSAMLIMIACGPDPAPETRTPPQSSAKNADVDSSVAPGADDGAPSDGRLGATSALRTNQIRTRHLFDGSVTAGKVAFVAVTVNVSAAASTGSSAADPLLVGGVLISCDPSGNQDQHLDNAVLNGDGSITATLAAAATAQNNFRCVVFKANAKGVS